MVRPGDYLCIYLFLRVPLTTFQWIVSLVYYLQLMHGTHNICCFNKFCMLIPCKANTIAHDVAQLFIKNWYPLCGLLKTIVSDRDTKFTSHFWRALFEIFGTKLNFSQLFIPNLMDTSRFIINWHLIFLRLMFMINNPSGSSICRYVKPF